MNFHADPKATVNIFTLLKKYSGWEAFKQVAEENAEALRKAILLGIEPEAVIKEKRQKLHAYEEIIDIPDHMINTFSEKPPVEDDSADPYDYVEEKS